MIVACVIDDGRPEYLRETIASMLQHVHSIDKLVLIDDSGDNVYSQELEERYPQFHQVHHETRLGLGGAVQSAWSVAMDLGADFVWHQEDDMPIVADVDLDRFVRLLNSCTYLAQVGLNRKPLNDGESRARSVVASNPQLYASHWADGLWWVETEHLFVFSPSLIPCRVIQSALDTCSIFLEREITDALWAQGYRSCYWGGMDDEPLCRHIGTYRSAGYHW